MASKTELKTRLPIVACLLLAAAAVPSPRTAAQTSPLPFVPKHIYSETADPRIEIAAALHQARLQHKRVILDFGGDWCGDCQVLDLYFHQPPNLTLLNRRFVLVHVFIGQMDRHLDIAAKYGVPVTKGVPALAVLDARGNILYAQKAGDFKDMRTMNPSSVSAFLNQWKG